MGREEQITDERKRKLEQLRKAEINPYPTRFDKKHTCLQALKSKLGAKVITAGRLIRKRNLGKITFCVLRDETSDIQIVFQAGETPKKTF